MTCRVVCAWHIEMHEIALAIAGEGSDGQKDDLAHLAEWAQLLADLWGAAPLESELLRRWEYQGGSLTADPRQQA